MTPALVTFAAVLAVATFGLAPGQTPTAFGLEIGATGIAVWLFLSVALWRTREGSRPYGFPIRVVTNQLPALPFVAAGALLLAGSPAGMFGILVGTLFSLAAGLASAWILLVEIQR